MGFEGHQLGHSLLFGGLIPDPSEFGCHLSTLSSGDGIEHVALFMDQTALTRRSGKQLCNGSKQPLMPIGHNQIDVGGSSSTQILHQPPSPTTSLLPFRSTPNAVKMMVESALSLFRMPQ